MRLAACAVMSFCLAQESFCAEFAPVNPAFKQWQKERERKASVQTGTHTNETRRAQLLSADTETEGELGFAPGTFDASYLSSLNVNQQQGVQTGLDSRYDLREHGVLTSVKNQNPYGTCWAYATYASLESWLLKSGVGTFDFSENNMVNLHGGDWGFDEGGNGDRASAYLVRWGGPVLESQDPYANPGGSIETAPTRHVQNVRWIPGRTSYLDNDAIKRAILDFGAAYVSYYHSSLYYKSSTASYYFYGDTSRRGNHAVAVVGWDDAYPASNFAKTPPGNGAFIVRNSWGASWGEGGYFYVSYYDESFAWNTLYSFSNAEPADNYDSIYEYDPLGLVASYGYRSATAWGANIFQASSATKISAVGFYALAPNTTYTIYIYTGSTAGAPRSGTLAATQNGKSQYAGYVTVPLASPVSVSARQRFSVAVKLTTPGYNYPLACEYAYPGYTSDATAASGQSYLSSNGSSWSDFTQVDGSANFCLKVYAKAVTPVKPSLSAIAISGVSSLTSGQSAQFSCEAVYSDGSKKSVSPVWSIARAGQAYAIVSSGGLVTALDVSAQQTVTVQASYTEDGVTKDATWGMYVTVAAPNAPADVTATQGTEASCVRVAWTAPNGATEYAVYRATANNSANARHLANVTVPRYSDASAVPGVDYWYFIKAKNSSGASAFSDGANGWRKLASPDGVMASDNLLDKVALEWNEVEGAKYYHVYRAESIDGEKSPVSGWQTETAFDDTTAMAGVTYHYFIAAAVDASGNRPSDYSIAEDGTRVLPVTVDHLEIKGDASVASGAYADYTADAIYTDGHTAANVSPVTWSITGDGASIANGRVTAASVTENKTVVLAAIYTEWGKTVRGEKQIAIVAVKPHAPRNVSATASSQTISVTWSAVAGAASYKVYRTGGTGSSPVQECIGTTAGTTYSDTAAVPGITYSYAVSAVNGAGEGPQSSSVSATVQLPAPTGVTATSDRTDGVLVDWRRVKDNAPYQNGDYYFRVARAESSDGEKTELGSWTNETSFLDASATVDTPFYYFVRAATTSDGANASAYSDGVVGRIVPNAPTLISIAISGPDRVPASGTAVYSCAANYSDATCETVSPLWTAHGAGAIDSSGCLTALAVTEDASVSIAAAFGGKVVVKEVKVVAPAAASASVSNVRVTPRWPFSTLVDIDYTLVTEPEGMRAHVSLSGQDNDHNVPLAARTLTGDGATGSVAAGERRITWDIGADHPGFHAKSFDVNLEAVPFILSAPTNVTASQGTSTLAVNLAWSTVEDATGYEVWRSASPTSASADRIATVEDATEYGDTSATAGTVYFYWIKAVTEFDTSDFGDYVFGYRARVTVNVTFDGNGGTPSSSSMSYIAGNAYGTLPTATREGYVFAGWFTATSGGVQMTETSIISETVTVLYAHWTSNTPGGHEKVQLWEGGPYWATTNVGADNPEDYGYYFWWGDTVGYKWENSTWVASNGSLSNFSFCETNTPTYNKSMDTLQSEGWITADNVLTPEHDAAHVQWGDGWRIPTYQELNDLGYNCDWIWTTMNGVEGFVVRGRGDYVSASIFLPASGNGYRTSLRDVGTHGYVWTSVPTSDNVALSLFYFSSGYSMCSSYLRFSGQSIRPVQGATNVVTYTVTLDRQGGSGGTASVTATYGSAMPPITPPTRSGYTFGGYYTGTNGSGTQYYTADGSSARTWNLTSATTLYAKWTANASDGHEKVQLWEGGPYWATTNIGAENPEDYGYYFWWGDTVGYRRENNAWVATDGSSSNFSFNSDNTPTYGKDIATLQSEGWIVSRNGTYVLAPAHDAAHVKWGGDWRMPTKQELDDLNSNCDWSWTTMNGVNGYEVRGRGAYVSYSIFLPFAGDGSWTSLYNAGSYGYYWSSVLFSDNSASAWLLYFFSSSHYTYSYFSRESAQSVRPVQSYIAGAGQTYAITFDKQSGSGGTSSVTATYGSEMPSITVPSRSGYTFGGYYTGTNGSGTQYYTASGASARTWDLTRATTLYAKWTANASSHAKVQLWEGGPYWATTNIGAENPEDYGYYFWWGDTIGYKREGNAWVATDGSSSNFQFCDDPISQQTYNKDIATLQSEGWVVSQGGTYILAPAHDAAHVKWGGDWRMPTKLELDDLNSNCDWTWTTKNGVNGYEVRGRDGYASNRIFLPCVGFGSGTSLYDAGSYGNYWSSVPRSDSNCLAWYLYFFSNYYGTSDGHRSCGWSVRPVQSYIAGSGQTYTITFDKQSGSGGTSSVTATYGSSMPSITVPTRSGYTFGGYYTGTNGSGTQYYTASGESARMWDLASATTLYAKWTANASDGHGKVQLWEGGPYWATTNIGAENPEDYGYYFWWGDTVGYRRENNAWVASDGSSSNFQFDNDPISLQTYNKSIATLQSEGWIVSQNGTYVLAPAHDAAHVKWGGEWCMPTQQEQSNLNNNCDWTWTTKNGVNGYEVRGRGDYASNSIFLPCAGYGDRTSLYDSGLQGDYWSSVPRSDDDYLAWSLLFASGGHDTGSYYGRFYGLSVRPVQGFTEGTVSTVTLDQQGGSGGTANVTATYGSAMPPITVPTRSGYTFGGYYSDTNGSGTQYYTASGASARIWNLTSATTLYAKWTVNASDGHEKVQLWEGGPYWATTNIGAENPEDYGYYFWWGDTVGYRRENNAWVATDGSSSNFSFHSENTPTYPKDIATLLSEGWIVSQDGTYILTPEHDAAHVKWGGDWRMPTYQELNALSNNCDWTWAMKNGVKGYEVRGRGDYASNSIFLPCAGDGYVTSSPNPAGSYGCYWSSVPISDNSSHAWLLYFYSSTHRTEYIYRDRGQSVRPVQSYIAGPGQTYTITFDKQSGSGGTTSTTAVYGSEMPSITLPTRSGYTFGGYWTGTNGSGTQYYTADGESARTWDKTTATTLYAKWIGHDKVQLWEGGPYWATTNIGAENPEDYGYYFWWGDTVGYKWENDVWVASDGSSSNFSFDSENTPTYNKDIATLQSEGWVVSQNGTNVLASAHDAAHVKWGGDWRMPTKQELDDLNSNCDWTWTTKNGVGGYEVRGRGDYASNSIFLPCAGFGFGSSLSVGSHGYYWSSLPYSDASSSSWLLGFYSSYHVTNYYYIDRSCGQPVRPVQGFTE